MSGYTAALIAAFPASSKYDEVTEPVAKSIEYRLMDSEAPIDKT
jgi:hypothetical protein